LGRWGSFPLLGSTHLGRLGGGYDTAPITFAGQIIILLSVHDLLLWVLIHRLR
jgi:hypothetical protein